MRRLIPWLSFAVMFASTCTGGPQSGGAAQISTPATTQANRAGATDPLPSWNEGSTKNAFRDFVTRVTKEGSADFVPMPERIATFDNDGTLWSEKPLPFQLLFAFDRAKVLAPQHPDWTTRQPFASVLKGDMAGVMVSGGKGVLEIIAATHAGMTTDEFALAVQGWITGAKHPQSGRLYTEMVYQPMGNCSPICAATVSKPSSSLAVGSSSCVGGRNGSMEFHRSM